MKSLISEYKAQTKEIDDFFVDHTAAPRTNIMDAERLKRIYYLQSEERTSEKIIRHTAHYAGSGNMYIKSIKKSKDICCEKE